MASLSNINGLFDVHSTGAILFSTSHGTSGQILKSNGNAAPTWIPQSDIVGAYLPLAGGTLTGATATASGISFTVGGALTGTTATFSTVQISNGTSYNENIRMFPGSNDYSSLILGAVSGTSGTGAGQWSLLRYPAANSNLFSIRHNATNVMEMTTGGATTFTGLVSGITPTAAANFATKAYVDSLSPPGGPYVTISTNQTITGNKTFSTLTSFTASESVHIKGIRGQFTNEFLHIYNKVGIGNPAGWGQGETSTPNQGLSVYGGSNFSYGTSATSNFYGPVTATGKILLNANNINFESAYSGNGLVLSHHGIGPSNAIVSGDASNPDNLFINNGGAASDWSNVIITGNVGIEINTPQAPLSFDNIVGNKIDFYHNVTSGDRYGVEVQSSELRIFSGAQGASTGGITFGKTTTSTFTEAMRIRNDGNVGIGTTTPVSKLEVNGSIKATGITANIGSDPGVSLSYDTSNNIGLIETWSSKPLLTRTYNYQAFSIGTNEQMRITSTGIGIGVTSPGHKLEVNGGIRAGIAGNASANTPALKVYAAGASSSATAAIAIQQGTGEGDTIIFADYEPHVEWGISAQNSTDQIHFTAGTSTNNLGSKTFYNNAGTARTAYIKFNHDLTDGTTLIGGQIGMGRDYNGGIYAINTSSTPGIDSNWGLEVQRTANVDDYNTRLKYYPVSGQSRKAGIYDSRNARFSLYSDTNNNPDILIPHAFLGIGNTSPTYRLQLGTSGSLADSIRLGTYAVTKNTRQYIGYTRADSGLFEESGNGDTPSTVLAGVAGIRIVNTTGTIASSQADNSVQLLTHIYNGGSRVALHASYNGNIGIGNTSPQTTLHTGPTTTITNVFTARFAASNFFASGGNSMFYVPDTAANIMMFGSNQFGTNQIEFYHKNPGTSQAYVGRISTSGSATSYVTSSDYRLKENIVPISDSISRLNQLKPSRFNFIEEPGKVVDGFIAHEVQDIVPEAIVGEKDEVDKDGGIIPQGIDQAKLVPLLVAAIQELEARVKELENR